MLAQPVTQQIENWPINRLVEYLAIFLATMRYATRQRERRELAPKRQWRRKSKSTKRINALPCDSTEQPCYHTLSV